jgi:hypothetical protein
VLLYFCEKATLAALRLEEALKNKPDLPLQVYLVSRQAHHLGHPDFQLLADEDGSFSRSYAAQPGTLYLLRPDGHIAARGFDFPLGQLPEILRLTAGWKMPGVKAKSFKNS